MPKKNNLSSKEYWEKREAYKLKKGLKDLKKIEKELVDEYKKAMNEIGKEISNLFYKYADDNNLSYSDAKKYLNSSEFREFKRDLKSYMKLIEETENEELLLELNTLSTKSRISRLEEMFYQCDKYINEVYEGTNKKLTEVYNGTVKDTYYQTIFDTHKAIGVATSFSYIDNDMIKDILAFPWSGRNYSQNLWINRTKLKENLKKEITQMIIRGEDVKTVSKRLRDIMFENPKSSDYKNCLRLIHTEHSYFMSEATAKAYEELDVEMYQYSSALDKRTCSSCGGLDGKKFNLSERKVGYNASPLHPYCRCTEIPYIEDEYSARFARDEKGKGIEVPSNMTYKEWEKAIKENNLDNAIKSKTKENEEIKKSKVKTSTEKTKEVKKAKETKKSKPKSTTKKVKETKPKLPKFKKPEAYKRQYGADMSMAHNDWVNSLSSEQKEAIKKYTNQGWYSVINKKLRSGDKLTDSNTDKILKGLFDDISSALATNKIPKNMQVYRGSSASIFKDLLSEDLYKQMRNGKASVNELKDKLLGTIVKDDAYMSTTVIDDLAFHKSQGFIKNVLFKIDIDKNATGAGYIAEMSEVAMEAELLFDKGTKLYIKDIAWNEDFKAYEVLCHYLGQ